MASKPLFEVFLPRARGIGHILRGRVYRMDGFAANEPLTVDLLSESDGTPALLFRRKSDGHGVIRIGEIMPDGLAKVLFGEEHIHKSEQIGSTEEIVDNRHGVAPIDITFRDLFSKTDSESTTQSEGGSVKLTIEAEEDIEVPGVGGGSLKESLETEAHTEFEESSGSSTTREDEGGESTTVPVGKRVRVTETRARADGDIDVTAEGRFKYKIAAGKHSGGRFVGGHNGYWDSFEDFSDVVRGEAPDNWDLAPSFKEHAARHADLWALDPLVASVRYKVTFEGRVLRAYSVEQF